jgi:hypothetical protein
MTKKKKEQKSMNRKHKLYQRLVDHPEEELLLAVATRRAAVGTAVGIRVSVGVRVHCRYCVLLLHWRRRWWSGELRIGRKRSGNDWNTNWGWSGRSWRSEERRKRGWGRRWWRRLLLEDSFSAPLLLFLVFASFSDRCSRLSLRGCLRVLALGRRRKWRVITRSASGWSWRVGL